MQDVSGNRVVVGLLSPSSSSPPPTKQLDVPLLSLFRGNEDGFRPPVLTGEKTVGALVDSFSMVGFELVKFCKWDRLESLDVVAGDYEGNSYCKLFLHYHFLFMFFL
jgi:hypothetical protein